MTSIDNIEFFRDKKILSAQKMETKYGGNELYHIETDKGVFGLRKTGRGDSDPKSEYQTLSTLSKSGITSHEHFYDPQEHIVIYEWIDGEHRYKLGVDDLIGIATMLKKLHSIDISKIDMPTIDLKNIVKSDDEDVIEAFRFLANKSVERALCHNDLNPDNIIWNSEGVKLIDFEYAAVNDIYFDLASVVVEFGLSEIPKRVFLEEYFGDESFDIFKLSAYEVIYDALRRQWISDHTP